MKTTTRTTRGILAAATVVVAALAFVPAGRAEVSFSGETVNLIINSNAGGGTDLGGRLVGQTLVKYLPGQPRILFQNIGGGGGIQANNYFVQKVKPDGRTMITGSRSVLSPLSQRREQVRYDVSTYEFVGGSARLGSVILIREPARARLTDPKAPPVVFGDVDGERPGPIAALWAKEYLGWNVRWVIGYGGTSQMLLAARRGEADMVANQNVTHINPLIGEAGFVPVAQMGNRSETGKMVAREQYRGVPVFDDMIAGKLDAKALRSYNFWMNDQLVDKWFALPPGTPKDVVETYRAAFKKAVRDPEFLRIAQTEFGAEYSPLTGEQLGRITADLKAVSDADIAFLNELRRKNNLPVR